MRQWLRVKVSRSLFFSPEVLKNEDDRSESIYSSPLFSFLSSPSLIFNLQYFFLFFPLPGKKKAKHTRDEEEEEEETSWPQGDRGEGGGKSIFLFSSLPSPVFPPFFENNSSRELRPLPLAYAAAKIHWRWKGMLQLGVAFLFLSTINFARGSYTRVSG